MEKPTKTVEETVVKHAVEGAASGLRLAVSLALIVVGVALVALGLFVISPLGLRIPLALIGVAFIAVFGLVAAGARRIGGARGLPSAELPQDETVTTTVTTTGFPKQGKFPKKEGDFPKEGEMPAKHGSSPADVRPPGPDLGGADDSGA